MTNPTIGSTTIKLALSGKEQQVLEVTGTEQNEVTLTVTGIIMALSERTMQHYYGASGFVKKDVDKKGDRTGEVRRVIQK